LHKQLVLSGTQGLNTQRFLTILIVGIWVCNPRQMSLF